MKVMRIHRVKNAGSGVYTADPYPVIRRSFSYVNIVSGGFRYALNHS